MAAHRPWNVRFREWRLHSHHALRSTQALPGSPARAKIVAPNRQRETKIKYANEKTLQTEKAGPLRKHPGKEETHRNRQRRENAQTRRKRRPHEEGLRRSEKDGEEVVCGIEGAAVVQGTPCSRFYQRQRSTAFPTESPRVRLTVTCQTNRTVRRNDRKVPFRA